MIISRQSANYLVGKQGRSLGMENFMNESYERATYRKEKEFNQKLEELQKTISPGVIRAYLGAESIQKEESVRLDLNLNDEQKSQLEELKALRISGIQAEIHYALAQARKNGVELSEEIVSGRSIVPGFSRELLDKVPSLGVYHLFMPYTKEEFDQILK